MFNVRQLAALKSLHYWRDTIARQQDESTGYEGNFVYFFTEIII
jgi:hypothetical protein